MGLEGVELIMEVEDRFGISIPDEDAERMTTVGAIHRYVVERLRELPDDSERCPSAAAFYRVRSALAAAFGTERSLVQPDVPMAELFGGRREHWGWSVLQNQLGFRLPRLVYPRWRRVSVYVWAFLFLATPAYVWLTSEAILIPCALLPLVVGFVLWLELTDRFGRIPASCATVRDIVETVASRWFHTGNNTDPEAVWDGLREVISEQFGVRPETILRETRLVDDLGC